MLEDCCWYLFYWPPQFPGRFGAKSPHLFMFQKFLSKSTEIVLNGYILRQEAVNVKK